MRKTNCLRLKFSRFDQLMHTKTQLHQAKTNRKPLNKAYTKPHQDIHPVSIFSAPFFFSEYKNEMYMLLTEKDTADHH